jgi:hypothetical protein
MAGEPPGAAFMRIPAKLLLFCGALLLALNACSKKAVVNAQVSELEKAFPAAAAPATVAQTEPPSPNQGLPADATAVVNLALSAVRTNDYAQSVIALQAVQQLPGVTAPQLIAVQRTMEAMTADLVARAARGDAKAKADLAAIEKTRSQ